MNNNNPKPIDNILLAIQSIQKQLDELKQEINELKQLLNNVPEPVAIETEKVGGWFWGQSQQS